MFRPATRQLARSYAGISLRVAARSARSAYRSPSTLARFSPAAGLPISRSYSSKSPRDPENGKGESPKNEGGESKRKELQTEPDGRASRALPPGWVHLSEEEISQVEAFVKTLPPAQQEKTDLILRHLRASGVPLELRELLEKQRTRGLGMLDGLKALKLVVKLADDLGSLQDLKVKQTGNKPPSTDFNSNKPGQQENAPPSDSQRPEEQSSQQQRQQPQEENQSQDQQQSRQQGKSQGQKSQQPPPPPGAIRLDISDIALGAGTFAIIYTFYSMFTGESSREITWQELQKNFLNKGLVEKMTVVGDRVRVDLNREAVQSVYPDSIAARPGFHYYFSIGSVDAFERRLDEAQQELGVPLGERIPVSYATSSVLTNLVFAFGPTLLLVGLLVFISRRAGGGVSGGSGGMFGFGKSKAKMFNHETAIKVKFSDVAGMDEAKVEIMEFVSFLRTPERFQRLGAKIPRGAILSGPPGTGKTLLAKATAGESQVPFFSVSGSEFVEMFVGVGASRVRDLFSTARKNAPCIIFIDEIDAVGKSRADGGGFRGGGNDEREATLNQILTEMDGFNTTEQVVVLAGTNRPDILDQALMRPGRFDRHIHIDRPTMKGRQDIFRVHLKQIVTNEDMEYLTGRLAALTPGFAGADIANAVNEAALVGT